MRLKLLFDMNLPPRFAEHFCQLGFESKHWSNVGNNAAKDTEIAEYARVNDYVVLTFDLDFSAILAATQGEKPSVIQIRTDELLLIDVPDLIEQVLTQLETELSTGAIVTIEADRSRVRILPLQRNV